MECALISFGFAMGQTIAGITQTNRTATHQQLHQVKYWVVYVVIFFSTFCCCLCGLFLIFMFDVLIPVATTDTESQ